MKIVFLVLLLIAFLLILKLMLLITDYELNIDLKNIELNHSIPLTTHWKQMKKLTSHCTEENENEKVDSIH